MNFNIFMKYRKPCALKINCILQAFSVNNPNVNMDLIILKRGEIYYIAENVYVRNDYIN